MILFSEGSTRKGRRSAKKITVVEKIWYKREGISGLIKYGIEPKSKLLYEVRLQIGR
jgi:hypothetical protein